MMLYLLLLVCITSAAFFSCVQVALFALTPIDLKVSSHVTNRRKLQIKKLLDQPRDLLVTLLFCEVSAAIILQNTFARLFGDSSSWLITVGVPIVLTLLLGEIFPKSLALPYRAKIASKVAPLMLTTRQLLGPICRPITRLTSSISHLIFPHLKPNRQITHDEIAYLVDLSEKGGVVDETEARWLHNYLGLFNHTLKEKMHPRDELIYYSIDTPIERLEACFEKQADVPICRKDLQNVLGILNAATYFKNKTDLRQLIQLLSRPFFAPESLPLISLFTQWLQSTSKLCLVVDEYGVITGWLTRPDLMRMILSTQKTLPHDDNDPLIVSGKMELAEFSERFDIRLTSPHHMTTLGGWIIEKLGEIPKTGTTLSQQGFLFQVIEAQPNKIAKVSIKRIEQ